MELRRLLASMTALLLFLGGTAPSAQAQTAADVALAAIDELVHQWEGGEVSAEDALEFIEGIVHDVPASQRTGILLDIDGAVHHWEDGDLTAEAAMEEIEGVLHGGGHDHSEAGAVPSPAVTGGAGFTMTGASAALSLGLLVLTALAIGGARRLGAVVRR